jgi:hypothetical protein
MPSVIGVGDASHKALAGAEMAFVRRTTAAGQARPIRRSRIRRGTLMKNLTLTCLILATSSSVASAADNDYLRTVLLTGDAIQGVAATERVAKYLFPTSPPAITTNGSVSGLSFLEGGGQTSWARWLEISSTPTALIRTPSQLTIDGLSYKATEFGAAVSGNDDTAVVGLVADSPMRPNSYLLVTASAGKSPQIVAEELQPDPGPTGENRFGQLRGNNLPAINDSGSLAFRGGVRGMAAGDDFGAEAIWGYRNGVIELIAHSEKLGDNTVPEGKIADISYSPFINSSNQVALLAGIQRGGRTRNIVMTEAGGGGLKILAEAGAAAPGVGEGVNFHIDSRFDTLNFNGQGQAAFVAKVEGPGVIRNSGGIWRGVTAGDLEPVILSGDVLPSFPPGHKATGFSQLLMNESGQLAFRMVTAAGGLGSNGFPTSNDRSIGVYAGSDRSDIRLVAKAGAPGPGLAPGEKMYPLDANPNQQPGLAINGRGAVAFSGRILGEVERFDNNIAIWAEDVSGKLRLIVRTGQAIDVDDGPEVDLRTVSRVDFLANRPAGYNPHDGFNDSGLLAFSAEFTDGSAGVFVSSLAAVPEPGGTALVAAAAMLVGALRKPRADFSPRRAQRSRRSIVRRVAGGPTTRPTP